LTSAWRPAVQRRRIVSENSGETACRFFFDLSGWPEKTNFRLGCRSTWIENPPIRTAEQADSTSATTLNGARSRDFVINQAQKNLNCDVNLPATASTRYQRRALVGLASASFFLSFILKNSTKL